jgi:hypothetical protein
MGSEVAEPEEVTSREESEAPCTPLNRADNLPGCKADLSELHKQRDRDA